MQKKAKKIMQELTTYTQTFRVKDTDCDLNGYLMPGAFLRMVQQLSTDHCESIGLNQEFYEKNNAIFLMAKMALQWERVPRCGEVITLTTRPENCKRATYKRVTTVQDEQGNALGMTDSRWVLVDPQARRIIRRPPEAFQNLPFRDDVDYQLDMTIERPQEVEQVGQAAAYYTFCDINGHLNNTRYADIACDALPLEQLRQNPVRRISISYHNEVPAGEHFQVQRGSTQSGWYVSGTREGKCCFEAELTL